MPRARGLAHLAGARLREGSGARLTVVDVDGLEATAGACAAHPVRKALGPTGFAKSAGG